jgi:hypothetical protein
MKTKLYSLFIMLALLASIHTVAAQGTAFTYQGRLNNAGGPANGTYDVTYKLWNALTGGGQVGSTFTVSGTVISNGLFTATLDFGSVFNGSSYWLELAVRTNGAASYSTLSPRQEVTPTPYAVTAENVDGLVPASQLSGTLPSGVLSGAYGDPLNLNNAGNNFSGTFSGSGTGLTGVALLAGGNTFSGNQVINGMLNINDGTQTTYHTDQTFAGGYSIGEEHSINFDDISGHIGALIVGFDGTDSYFSVGNLWYQYVHATTSTKAFTVFGNGNVVIDPQSLNAGFINNENTNSSGLTFGSASGEGIASQRTPGTNQYDLSFYTAFNNRMTIMNNGFVGINTTNPLAQLHVVSSTGPSGDGGDNFFGGPGIWVDSKTSDGVYSSVYGNDAYAFWGVATNISGVGGYFTSTVGTGVYAYSGTGSALTIGSGAIHVSGASTNNPSTAAFIQVATAANTSSYITTINNSLCDGDPQAILIATHNWNPVGVSGNYETHPYSVYYDGAHWTIYNDDETSILGMSFNVLVIKN